MQNLWDKFVDGKDGKPVIAQRPNLPIILWAVFTLLAKFMHTSPWHGLFEVASSVSLAVWAILEIGWGASYFRRTLGALVLAFAIASRFM